MANINLKIDVTKILKQHLFQGKNGAKYLDITLWENKEGEDRFGNTHMAVQDLPRELRDAGEKGPILGNGKEFGGAPKGRDRTPQDGYKKNSPSTPAPAGTVSDEDDDIPF